MKKIESVFQEIKYELLNGRVEDTNINGIQYDSRKVKNGDLFVCRVGANSDGHNYIEEAIKRGAKAIVVQKEIEKPSNVTVLKVENTDLALSKLADNYYEKPSEKIVITGITGTNGKTSISYLVQELLKVNDLSVGVIGTIGMVLNSTVMDLETTMPTTPDSLELQKALSIMLKAGANDVVMEVSSIALDQSRVQDTNLDIGVFTNLTVDHLDYHITMENYKKAKFELFKKCPINIINLDCDAGKDYVKKLINEFPEKKTITYSTQDKSADFYATNIKIKPGKTTFDLIVYQEENIKMETNLTGRFNVSNVLASIAVAYERGVSLIDIKDAFVEIKGARGRFETLTTEGGVTVIVDYAHTPDALEKVLETINEFKENGYKRVLTVFGCGGDRDKTKRSQMGEVSERMSDYTIITSDNPRTEEPEKIIEDIEKGFANQESYEVEVNRAVAIEKVMLMAQKGDIVLVAGKGHETYQIIGKEKYHFDDIEEAKKHF